MKGWVNLGTTQWVWTRTAWIGNPVPWPLWHFSNKLSIHSCFFSIAFPCLLLAHPTLFEHYCFCSFQIFNQFSSNEFLTYHPKLFSFILIHPSQLINPLPPISLLRCTKSTSFWRCSTPYIVINFLVLLSKLFNSSVFHFRVPAPVPIPYKNHPSINYHNFISSIQFQSVLTAAYTLC